MKVKVGARTLDIHWVHVVDKAKTFFKLNSDESYNTPKPPKVFSGQFATVCTVVGGTYMAQGFSFLRKPDTYNPEVGRKLSLTRALRVLKLSKKQRKIVWDSYFGKDRKVNANAIRINSIHLENTPKQPRQAIGRGRAWPKSKPKPKAKPKAK